MKITKQNKVETKSNSKINADHKLEVYEDAISYIKSSMNSLSKLAKDGDVIAKDAIVNMSVIAFDLKGSQKD